MKKVSIIVPIYNSEKFLNRCIDSILMQSYKNIELILIDDGSKDGSLSIIKDYSLIDKRIFFISQKNSGPAIARNNGIKMATGVYIMFIDSDDYIDENYIETYVNEIENTNCDVVMGGYKKVSDKSIDFIRKLNNGIFSKYIVPGPVSKIYKTKFIRDKGISFLDTKSSEDVYFNMNIIKETKNIKCIDNIGYYYYYNKDSISNTMHKGFNDKVDVENLLEEINYDFIDDIELHQYFIIRYVVWYLLYSGKGESPNKFYFYYKKYFKWLENNISKFTKNRHIKIFGPSGEIPKIGFIIYIFLLLHKFKLIYLFSKFYCKNRK